MWMGKSSKGKDMIAAKAETGRMISDFRCTYGDQPTIQTS
jgi:hypothetical protein